MRIGVLELLSPRRNQHLGQAAYNYLLLKQYASIMPQIIASWCREFNHTVYYNTYFGQLDPVKLLPNDLDVVFISTYTQGSLLAYSLARLYRKRNTLTVVGGPHAKQFSDDCLRFFDVVVRSCDKTLISEVLKDRPRGQIVDTDKILNDVPSIQERLPEILTAHFFFKNPAYMGVIPMLSSTGCPFDCDFCVDWDNPYHVLPFDRLREDLNFVLCNFPNAFVSFSDPNFGVNFDQLMELFETLPKPKRKWYLIECNLSSLREHRIQRLRDTGCLYVMPGVESFNDYSKKAGIASKSPEEKLEQVIGRFELISRYIPGMHANFLFGLDTDEGDTPVALIKEFMKRAPYVMPNINVPMPFGGTPLYRRYYEEKRILMSMPFAFYGTPYLTTIPKHYSPLTFYEQLNQIVSCIASTTSLFKRSAAMKELFRFFYNPLRTIAMKRVTGESAKLYEMLKNDEQFRAFHQGKSQELPEFYHQRVKAWLGDYHELLSRRDIKPYHAERTFRTL